ncbi:hypothetical protein DY000_02041803 [Brassica cretica]|uniref:Uncharacterized protein n=1 Tax=Brassica cretica TaxID=69181 RepID=A0ABQ7BM62_BRACR|nr:hypothetical protein DY000_02041803 [Brassica cretica]
MHRDATTGSSRCLGAITPCQRESLVITGQTSHVLLSRTELERCIYDVRRRRTKTEPPSHHRRTDQIHTVVSRKPLEEAVIRPWRRNSVCRPETSTLGVVYVAAQLSRPVVPWLRGETDEYMIFRRIGATGLFIRIFI